MKSLVLQVLVVLMAAFLLAGSSLFSAKQLKNEEAATPVPQECAGADFDQLGKPVMINPSNGLLFGLSVGTKRIVYGQQVPLYLWIVNSTDKPQSVHSSGLAGFLTNFDVYDVNQNRVLTIEEQKNSRYRQAACMGYWNAYGDGAFLTYAPHSCTKPDHPYDLRESYALTPGKYVLAIPQDMSYCEQGLTGSKPAKVQVGRIPILIEPK